MIYWTPEGSIIGVGLNFYITFKKRGFWFRIILKTASRDGSETLYYFRFRSFMSPHFIIDKNSQTLEQRFKSFLFNQDLYLVTREQYLDLIADAK